MLAFRAKLWRRHLTVNGRSLRFSEVKEDIEKLNQDVAALENQDTACYAALLIRCGNAKALWTGKRVHAHILKNLIDGGDTYLGNHLVKMYSSCGSIQDASNVFESMEQKNIISWNIMISGYSHNKQHRKALQVFYRMDLEGVKLNEVTLITVVGIVGCFGSIAEGWRIHWRITQQVGSSDQLSVKLGTALVTMYGKCGSVEAARRVFDGLSYRNEVTWNAMIGSYAQQHYPQEALEVFDLMDVQPNEISFVCALNACADAGNLEQGKRIHCRIGCEYSGQILSTALINMYGKCGSVEEAKKVFEKMRWRDLVAWTAMIAAYAQQGYLQESLGIFQHMEQQGIKSDAVVYTALLEACTSSQHIAIAKKIEERVCMSGLDCDVGVSNALLNLQRRCGQLSQTENAFSNMKERDVMSWNAMISGYVEHGNLKDAERIFQNMDLEGVKQDQVTFNSILAAYSSAKHLAAGRRLHQRIDACGICIDATGTALIKMYGDCRSVEDARLIFDRMRHRDVVTWSAMIAAYAAHYTHFDHALRLYDQMRQLQQPQPNDITYISLLDACANGGDLTRGREIHGCVEAAGYDSHVVVATALVNMYGKCGSLDDARRIFDQILPSTDVIAWTAMITAYIQHRQHRDGLDLFFRLESDGVKPDKVAYGGALEACACLADLTAGTSVHASMAATGMEYADVCLGNMLVTMYGKCGSLARAVGVFRTMVRRDVVTWNAVIAVHTHHGNCSEVLELLGEMMIDGTDPDAVTLVSVLSTCGHAGLVRKGSLYFTDVAEEYGIERTEDHYGCMVDLLGRAGELDDAECMIDVMIQRLRVAPKDPTVAWMTLLSACRTHGDIARACRAAHRVWKIDPSTNAPHILLANIYAAAGLFHEALKIRTSIHLDFLHHDDDVDVVDDDDDDDDGAVVVEEDSSGEKRIYYT